MSTDYCTAADVKVRLGIPDGDTLDDASIGDAVSAASRQIDAWCGRRFWIDDNLTDRYFWADNPQRLDLFDQPGDGPKVDIATADGLVVAVDNDDAGTYGTALTVNTDFYLAPINAPADGWGYSELMGLDTGSVYWPRGGNRPLVKITAKFGFPAVPADVKEACIVQAAQLFKTKDAVFGAVALGESASMYVRAALNPTAKALLASYQRAPVG